MASYPRVTPATLTNFQAVINDPLDSEDANKLGQIDLQTRRFVFDWLDQYFDKSASDVLKPAAIAATSLAGKVQGSTSNVGTQRAIQQGTVSTPDLRDEAVTAAKIGAAAITTVKIGDDQITTFKINNLAVTTAKIADANVTQAKIAADAVTATELKDDVSGAAGAVTTDHIRSNAVTAAKIAANVVGPDQLVLAGAAGHIFVGDGSNKFQSVAVSGDASLSSTGVLTLTQNGISVVEEKAANGVNGGTATTATWNNRGVTVPWVIKFQTVASMINLGLGAGKISFAAAGNYIIRARGSSYKTDRNVIRINRFNSGNVSQETFNGTTAKSAATDACTSTSFVEARVAIAAGDYIMIQHWAETTEANDGLGLAVSTGSGDEIHCSVEIQKSA